MALETRSLTRDDEGLLTSWWLKHGQSPVPFRLWPKRGLLISNENAPLAAGFIYFTDSPIAFIENIVIDPSSAKIERRAAVHKLLEDLESLVRRNGYSLALGLVTSPKMAAIIEKTGWTFTQISRVYVKGV